MSKRVKSFISLFLVIWIFMIAGLLIIADLIQAGYFQGIWEDILEAFPFGRMFGKIATAIAIAFLKLPIIGYQYESQFQEITNPLYFIQESQKMCIVAILYEALSKVGNIAMGLDDKVKGWRWAQKALWQIVCAIFCAVICGMVMQFVNGQINSLSINAGRICSFIISTILLGGAFGVFYLLLAVNVAKVLLYLFVKIICINTASVSLIYLLIVLFVLLIKENAFSYLLLLFYIWILFEMILLVISLMFESIFE